MSTTPRRSRSSVSLNLKDTTNREDSSQQMVQDGRQLQSAPATPRTPASVRVPSLRSSTDSSTQQLGIDVSAKRQSTGDAALQTPRKKLSFQSHEALKTPRNRDEFIRASAERDILQKILETCSLLKLPEIEVQLYREHLQGENRLSQLSVALEILTEHKKRTLQVISAIRKREELLGKLKRIERHVTETNVLAQQKKALLIICQLQDAGLDVVEKIQAWRLLLTKPFPFLYKDRNYLVKMNEDLLWCDGSKLSKLLPCTFEGTPLLSAFPSLSFSVESIVREANGEPSAIKRVSTTNSKIMLRAKQLQRAESALAREVGIQTNLSKQALQFALENKIIPIINNDSLFKNSFRDGVPLDKANPQMYGLNISELERMVRDLEEKLRKADQADKTPVSKAEETLEKSEKLATPRGRSSISGSSSTSKRPKSAPGTRRSSTSVPQSSTTSPYFSSSKVP